MAPLIVMLAAWLVARSIGFIGVWPSADSRSGALRMDIASSLHQTVVECRQRECPGRGEFRPAVQDAGHPEEMQSFAQWINWLQQNLHGSEYARHRHVVHQSRSAMNMDERAAIRDV